MICLHMNRQITVMSFAQHELNGSAADLTVFHILLASLAGIYQHRYLLSAVGALDISFFQSRQHR